MYLQCRRWEEETVLVAELRYSTKMTAPGVDMKYLVLRVFWMFCVVKLTWLFIRGNKGGISFPANKFAQIVMVFDSAQYFHAFLKMLHSVYLLAIAKRHAV